MASSSLPAAIGGPPSRCLALHLTRFAMPSLSPVPRWSLTPPFHPYPKRGGLLSAALSVALLLLAVSQRHVLWCPDFPLTCSDYFGSLEEIRSLQTPHPSPWIHRNYHYQKKHSPPERSSCSHLLYFQAVQMYMISLHPHQESPYR